MKAITCPNDCSNATTQTQMATLLQMNTRLAGSPTMWQFKTARWDREISVWMSLLVKPWSLKLLQNVLEKKKIQKQEDQEDATHILSQFLQLPQKMGCHILGKENMKIWCRGATLHRSARTISNVPSSSERIVISPQDGDLIHWAIFHLCSSCLDLDTSEVTQAGKVPHWPTSLLHYPPELLTFLRDAAESYSPTIGSDIQ